MDNTKQDDGSKVIASNFLISRDIPVKKSFLSRLFRKDEPKTSISYFMHLSDKSVLQATIVLKGYPTYNHIQNTKEEVKEQVMFLYRNMIGQTTYNPFE